MSDTDRFCVFFKFFRDRLEPFGNRLDHELACFIRTQICRNLSFQRLIGIGELDDFTFAPACEDGNGRIADDRLGHRIDDVMVEFVDMFLDDIFHNGSVVQIFDFLAELAQFFIDLSGPCKTAGYGKLRFGTGDDDCLREYFRAPLADARHLGNAAGKEQQLRGIAGNGFADIAQGGKEHTAEGISVETFTASVFQMVRNRSVHLNTETDRRERVTDQNGVSAFMVREIIHVGVVFFL